jgi:hypothetical protein
MQLATLRNSASNKEMYFWRKANRTTHGNMPLTRARQRKFNFFFYKCVCVCVCVCSYYYMCVSLCFCALCVLCLRVSENISTVVIRRKKER